MFFLPDDLVVFIYLITQVDHLEKYFTNILVWNGILSNQRLNFLLESPSSQNKVLCLVHDEHGDLECSVDYKGLKVYDASDDENRSKECMNPGLILEMVKS